MTLKQYDQQNCAIQYLACTCSLVVETAVENSYIIRNIFYVYGKHRSIRQFTAAHAL